jgi:hypothetical protein
MSKATKEVKITGINKVTLQVKVIGDTPLLVNQFSKKAIDAIISKQGKEAQQAREARNPQAEYEASLYRDNGAYVFPANAFREAMEDAAPDAQLSRAVVSRSIRVLGHWVKIEGSAPRMQVDMGRIGPINRKVAMPIYRGAFDKWTMTINIVYNANAISADQVVNLLNVAGFAIGIGAWRPQKGGNNGMFHVSTGKEK